MRVFRVYARKHDAAAFTGEGPRLFGGRWTSPGMIAEYTATSLSLAVLEIMANSGRRLPLGRVFRTVDIPDDVHVERTVAKGLPARWYEIPAPPELHAIGDEWVRRGESVALLIPSAIVRIEENVLLNPRHADFARLIIGDVQNIPIDQRLR